MSCKERIIDKDFWSPVNHAFDRTNDFEKARLPIGVFDLTSGKVNDVRKENSSEK